VNFEPFAGGSVAACRITHAGEVLNEMPYSLCPACSMWPSRLEFGRGAGMEIRQREGAMAENGSKRRKRKIRFSIIVHTKDRNKKSPLPLPPPAMENPNFLYRDGGCFH